MKCVPFVLMLCLIPGCRASPGPSSKSGPSNIIANSAKLHPSYVPQLIDRRPVTRALDCNPILTFDCYHLPTSAPRRRSQLWMGYRNEMFSRIADRRQFGLWSVVRHSYASGRREDRFFPKGLFAWAATLSPGKGTRFGADLSSCCQASASPRCGHFGSHDRHRGQS